MESEQVFQLMWVASVLLLFFAMWQQSALIAHRVVFPDQKKNTPPWEYPKGQAPEKTHVPKPGSIPWPKPTYHYWA